MCWTWLAVYEPCLQTGYWLGFCSFLVSKRSAGLNVPLIVLASRFPEALLFLNVQLAISTSIVRQSAVTATIEHSIKGIGNFLMSIIQVCELCIILCIQTVSLQVTAKCLAQCPTVGPSPNQPKNNNIYKLPKDDVQKGYVSLESF